MQTEATERIETQIGLCPVDNDIVSSGQ